MRAKGFMRRTGNIGWDIVILDEGNFRKVDQKNPVFQILVDGADLVFSAKDKARIAGGSREFKVSREPNSGARRVIIDLTGITYVISQNVSPSARTDLVFTAFITGFESEEN